MEFSYIRKANYHETDQMGIIHHSNYIKWFEEARVACLDHIGLPYNIMEEDGVYSPVLGISCDYKAMVRFNDQVDIRVSIIDYTGIKLIIGYQIYSLDGKTCHAIGESKHCFVDKNYKLIRVGKNKPHIDQVLKKAMDAPSSIPSKE